MTCGSGTQLVPTARWWRWGDKTGTKWPCCPPATFKTPPWYQGSPAEWHHGNQITPHRLAKLVQISTSDSFVGSLANGEVKWVHRGTEERSSGVHPAVPVVLYNDHWAPCWGAWTWTTRCLLGHLSLLPAGYSGSLGRVEQCLGRQIQGLWDQLWDSAPSCREGKECKISNTITHWPFLTFAILNISLLSLHLFLCFIFSHSPSSLPTATCVGLQWQMQSICAGRLTV